MIDGVLTLSGIFGSAGCGCAVGWLLASGRSARQMPRPTVEKASRDEAAEVTDVKAALEALRRRPFYRQRPEESPSLLEMAICEIAASPCARDAQAGRLLLDYYIKRVGSHEVVMQRLYLSRPTFYRRLKHGLELVAERLEEVNAASSAA